MLTPVNYVDLFDRLYPAQHLVGLRDDNQLNVEELNHRYGIIHANMRTMSMAMNAIYAAQPDGAHFRDYMTPFWEVAYAKKFCIDPRAIASLRYVRGYDPAGLVLDFDRFDPRIVLYANDCGSEILTDYIEVCVFVDGLLVPSTDYVVHPSQGGFAVYVKEAHFRECQQARIVLFRKFNQRGLSFERVPASQLVEAGAPLFDGTPAGHIAFDLQKLGHVHDIRYYSLFAKKFGDSYFRPVPKEMWSSRHTPGYDTLIAGVTGDYAEPYGYEFVLIDRAEFWKKEVTGSLNPEQPIWSVDLVDDYGMPLPVMSSGDLDVWVKGRKLVADKDYWVEFGSSRHGHIAPRVMFEDIIHGDDVHLYMMAGVPSDCEAGIEIEEDILPNHDSIVRLDPRRRKLRLIENMGLVFSHGYLELAGDGIETIADNLALHFDGLRDAREFNFRMRFCLPPEVLGAALRQCEIPTTLERFARTVGAIPEDGFYDENWSSGDYRPQADNCECGPNGLMDFRPNAYTHRRNGKADYREQDGCTPNCDPCNTATWDLVKMHKRNHPTPPVPLDFHPERNRRNFPAMYFYLRDEYEAYPTADARQIGDDHLDYDPWRQGDRVVLDFRGRDYGPSDNVTFDFRGEIFQTIPEYAYREKYTTSDYVLDSNGRGDFRQDGLTMSEDFKKWVQDVHGNVALDGRDIVAWKSPGNSVLDFRGVWGPEYIASFAYRQGYTSGNYVLDSFPHGDFRSDTPFQATGALSKWVQDSYGNVALDSRDIVAYKSEGSSTLDFRGERHVPEPFVSYLSGDFRNSLNGGASFRQDGTQAPIRWQMDVHGNSVYDARDLTHLTDPPHDVGDMRQPT